MSYAPFLCDVRDYWSAIYTFIVLLNSSSTSKIIRYIEIKWHCSIRFGKSYSSKYNVLNATLVFPPLQSKVSGLPQFLFIWVSFYNILAAGGIQLSLHLWWCSKRLSTTSLISVICSHGLFKHLYADDTHLFLSFLPNDMNHQTTLPASQIDKRQTSSS